MYEFVPEIIEVDQKSNDHAKEARIIGNDRFSVRNFLYALNHYNRSIAFAKSNNVKALAYGNRSAVYFEVKLYQECLENIELARNHGFPANRMSKLNEREAKCKILMDKSIDKKTDTLWDFFKLSYEPNEKIPWVVDCVEMRQTEKYGRGIYAKQDLKAGDIICAEDAFFNYTIKDWNMYSTYFHCYNCLKPNKMNLIPCDRTASIMFCSSACKEDFYSKLIDKDNFLYPQNKLLADVAAHFGGYKQLDYYINRTDLKTFNKTIFDYDFSDPEDPEYKNKLMTCFLSLSANKKPSADMLKRSLEQYISKKTSDYLLSIYELNQRELKFDDGGLNIIKLGSHVSLFTSLINHSCVANAFSMNVGNKIVTILEKPVKAGEQIFFRYRQSLISFISGGGFEKDKVEAIHNFKCDCEACDVRTKASYKNYFDSAGKEDKASYEYDPIPDGNYELGKKKMKKYFDDINENPPKNAFPGSLVYCITILKSAAFLYNYSIPPHFRFEK